MKPIETYILIILVTFLSQWDWTYGQAAGTLLTKFRDDMESFIMEGYGAGWEHCDIVHDTSDQINSSEETLRFVMDSSMMHSSDIRATFSKSHCLLVSAHISSNKSLSDIIKFGWSVIQHKRIALVLQLGDGLTLDMAANTTKLPFMVAAIDDKGKVQFLCPVIGESVPRLQDVVCDSSYVSAKEKFFRVAIFGIPPYFYGKSEFNNTNLRRSLHVQKLTSGAPNVQELHGCSKNQLLKLIILTLLAYY